MCEKYHQHIIGIWQTPCCRAIAIIAIEDTSVSSPNFGNRVGWLAATGCCIFPISLACNSAHSPSVTRPSLSAIFRRSTTQLSKITLRSTLTLFTQFSQSFHTAAFEVQVHTVFTKIIHTEICVLFTSDVMRYALSDGQSITGYLFVSPPLTLRLHYVFGE